MKSGRWWLLIPAVAVIAFGVGVLVSRYVTYDVPYFVPEDARVEGYAVSALDDRDVRLSSLLGFGDLLDVPVVSEEASRVIVKLRAFRFVPARGGFKNLAGYQVRTRAFLREPLGNRTVIDGRTGQVVPRSPPEP